MTTLFCTTVNVVYKKLWVEKARFETKTHQRISSLVIKWNDTTVYAFVQYTVWCKVTFSKNFLRNRLKRACIFFLSFVPVFLIRHVDMVPVKLTWGPPGTPELLLKVSVWLPGPAKYIYGTFHMPCGEIFRWRRPTYSSQYRELLLMVSVWLPGPIKV